MSVNEGGVETLLRDTSPEVRALYKMLGIMLIIVAVIAGINSL